MPPEGSTPTDTTEAALWLQGMHCAGCSGLIESAVLTIAGVDDIRVSAALQRAQVSWNPDRTNLSRILSAIEAAGYGATLATPQGAQAARAQRLGRRLEHGGVFLGLSPRGPHGPGLVGRL